MANLGSYFEKFPLINYSNNAVVDITRKVKFVESARENPYLFYPYTLKEGERPDVLANKVYDNQYYDWSIYISNEIVDPYYGYYLESEQFQEFVAKKYGSIELALERVIYWRNNWEVGNELTISGFNALTPSLKKYWIPEYRLNSNVIVSYKRKRSDWVFNTNKLVKYVISGSHNFRSGELVVVETLAGEIVGQGEIDYVNGTSLVLKNVQQVGDGPEDYTLVGGTMRSRTTTSSVTIVSSSDIPGIGISNEELVYYSPVSAYDFELEKNEYNKTLILIRSENIYDINQKVEELFKQNV